MYLSIPQANNHVRYFKEEAYGQSQYCSKYENQVKVNMFALVKYWQLQSRALHVTYMYLTK